MSLFTAFKSHSPRSAWMLLVVGVLAGVTVGGGVGVIAASSTKTVTVCANKTTNMLRYAKNGKCATTDKKVVLNKSGVKGAKGAKGARGVAGVAGSSSPTGFTARSVCGASGTSLCAVGVQGPGGGTIFYVDTDNEILGYDYLEAAPADALTGVVWSTSTAKCGPVASVDCQTAFLSDASTALDYFGIGTGRAATAAIVARHNAGGVAKTDYAAGVADAYTTATASDWFLPSKDELALMYTNLHVAVTPLGGFSAVYYWSSSEGGSNGAWSQGFQAGDQSNYYKDSELSTSYVRPVRAF